MKIQEQVAFNLRASHLGGNLTAPPLKEILSDISWKQATKRVHNFHTIAELVFHINYYVEVVLRVLQGRELSGHDAQSYDLPPIESKSDWFELQSKAFRQAEQLSELARRLSDEQLLHIFGEDKYGTYVANLMGLCEHTYYHLGQIQMLKTMINSTEGENDGVSKTSET